MKTQFHEPVSNTGNFYHGEKISSKPEKYPHVSQRKYCSIIYRAVSIEITKKLYKIRFYKPNTLLT